MGSFCTVFAATEVLEKIRAGLAVEDIVKGAFRSVVNRVREMDVVPGALVMTGGVAAYNPALVRWSRRLSGGRCWCRPIRSSSAPGCGAVAAETYSSRSA